MSAKCLATYGDVTKFGKFFPESVKIVLTKLGTLCLPPAHTASYPTSRLGLSSVMVIAVLKSLEVPFQNK